MDKVAKAKQCICEMELHYSYPISVRFYKNRRYEIQQCEYCGGVKEFHWLDMQLDKPKEEFYKKFTSIPSVKHENSPKIIFTTIDEVWQWIESLITEVRKDLFWKLAALLDESNSDYKIVNKNKNNEIILDKIALWEEIKKYFKAND